MTVGVFALFGGGAPFYSDEIVKYKLYDLAHKTNAYTYIEESYQTNRLIDDELPKNQLIVYTPWIEMGEKYMRYKKEYEVDDSCTLDLFDAVLKEDYTYITNNIKDYKEEIQIVNSIEEIKNNNYIIEASLNFFDKKDDLRYKESDLKNFVITIIELVLGLGIGGLAAYIRDFDYLWEIKYVNSDYRLNIKAIKPMKKELKAIKENILSLSKTKGGK